MMPGMLEGEVTAASLLAPARAAAAGGGDRPRVTGGAG